MGGIIILLSTVVPTLLWAPVTNRFVLVAIGATLWMGAIGFLDDWLKIVQGKSRGLVAKWKLAGQVTLGLALGVTLLVWPAVPPDTIPASGTTLPFFKYVVVVFAPAIYVIFVTGVVTGFSNAVNLTDGLDGLATGLTAIAAGAFALFAYILGRVDATQYLNLFYLPGSGELAVFCGALMGASLGFLWFNAHPAQVFMGDTGSLAIGGAFGTVAILLKSEFLLVIVGGVFVAETVSVMIQTSTYKWFKRTRGKEYADAHRAFRMAPLHHHFEKLGWQETTVVTRFWILGIVCALVALGTLKVR
jgi:phospho-N-acetylmuramoyl-pentapeptide-transferase